MKGLSRAAAALFAALFLFGGGCDLLMSDLRKDVPIDSGPDADVGEYCPGYSGDDMCCTTDDWCLYADDGFCDCDGFCAWDENDCTQSDAGTDADTDSDTDSDTESDSGVTDAG